MFHALTKQVLESRATPCHHVYIYTTDQAFSKHFRKQPRSFQLSGNIRAMILAPAVSKLRQWPLFYALCVGSCNRNRHRGRGSAVYI
jgi:hypothetical protein